MKHIHRTAFLFVVIFPVLALAQGSGSTAPRPTAPDFPATNPFEVTKSFAGAISEIRLDLHVLVVEDKDGKRIGFKVDDHTAFKADKKSELGGHKNLKLEDFSKGQPVKVTFRPDTGQVVEVRLQHAKNLRAPS